MTRRWPADLIHGDTRQRFTALGYWLLFGCCGRRKPSSSYGTTRERRLTDGPRRVRDLFSTAKREIRQLSWFTNRRPMSPMLIYQGEGVSFTRDISLNFSIKRRNKSDKTNATVPCNSENIENTRRQDAVKTLYRWLRCAHESQIRTDGKRSIRKIKQRVYTNFL